MKTTVVAASGPIGANSAAIPAATPLTNLNKASIGRTAVEDVVLGIVFREFIPVCAKVLRGAVQQRAGLGQQGAPQVSAGRVPGRLGIGGFRSRRAALPGADVEPRLEDGAREEGCRGGEVFGPEVGIGACEELFVERPSHDGDDVTLFGSGNVGFGNDLRRQVFPFAEGEFQHLEGCD